MSSMTPMEFSRTETLSSRGTRQNSSLFVDVQAVPISECLINRTEEPSGVDIYRLSCGWRSGLSRPEGGAGQTSAVRRGRDL